MVYDGDAWRCMAMFNCYTLSLDPPLSQDGHPPLCPSTTNCTASRSRATHWRGGWYVHTCTRFHEHTRTQRKLSTECTKSTQRVHKEYTKSAQRHKTTHKTTHKPHTKPHTNHTQNHTQPHTKPHTKPHAHAHMHTRARQEGVLRDGHRLTYVDMSDNRLTGYATVALSHANHTLITH